MRHTSATASPMDSGRSRRWPLLPFFALVGLLSAPFFVLNAVTGWRLFPSIPISALTVFAPLLAASLLIYRAEGLAGVAALLTRCVDYRRILPLWYLPSLLLMPVISVLTYGILRWQGQPVPDPRIELGSTLVLTVVLFVMALGEEAGWTGYATGPMQARWGALGAGVLLGLVWAAWHLIPLLQVGRPLDWIAWWTLFTVTSRVLIVWLANNTGRSVLAAILFHTTMNVSYALFPVAGSWYDYRITGITTAACAVIVTVIWGPRTLTGWRPRGDQSRTLEGQS